MSLMKWVILTAGTAAGLRYMSDRHRLRRAQGGERTAGGPQNAQNQGPSSHGLGDDGLASSARHDDLLAPNSESSPGSSAGRF